jgi:5-hydroxyisourate hydrolase-like protein (transthyretin family)
VSGLFTAQGKPADHLVVKMQILNGDSWAQLTGAKMRTLSNGAYTMRVILQAKGERTLRAVGVVPGPARDAFKRFEVTVH